MSTPATITAITIDGTKYVRADQVTLPKLPNYRIVVADRGWVFVGYCHDEEDGAITITDAKCIRYWGTDNDKPGLGWLAAHGPTDKTILDDSGVVRIPRHSVIVTFDSTAETWGL